MPDFSPKQRQIIENRGDNILVSAAAGSGKTTVLVQRIIERILDPGDPVNIDEILVLTFTKSAAAEMRERIAIALSKELDKNPDNEHLQKQSALIYNAQITTIDSFCLGILKNNFTEIGLEPGFRLATEAEMTFLIDEVLEECIEDMLKANEIPYLDHLTNRFASKDSLKKLKEVLLTARKEADKAPFVNDYFDEHCRDYQVENEADLQEKDWVKRLYNSISRDIEMAISSAKSLIEECEIAGPVEYIPRIQTDLDYFESLKKPDFSAFLEAISNPLDWGRLPTKVSCDNEQKDKVKGKRDLYKDLINNLIGDYSSLKLEDLLIQMEENSKVTRALMEATRLFSNRLEDEKRKRGLITFSDMEHLALQILLKKEGDKYVPTQVALDYRDCFKELMIDEYQDSNYIQEALIHSISGEDDGRYDRFIVGDIKQSIYRFRNANPELFMEKYDEYTEDKGPLCRIDLSTNYRSRESVINATNLVFERLMDRDVGGVDYDKNQRLYAGAKYADADVDTGAELLLIEPDESGQHTKEELEAGLIAKRIKSLVATYMVQDKDTGLMRPCTYRDIVILIRGNEDMIKELRQVLDSQDIPAYVTSKSGYFVSTEIVTLLNYLRILNNPYDEIPLFGCLKSVFGSFIDDELALLKIIDRSSLYRAMLTLNSSEASDIKADIPALKDIELDVLKGKVSEFINRYESYRALIPYTPIHELIRTILEDFGYVDYMSALPMGEQRRANILMLLSKAESYENNGFKGLFNFIRYIEKLKKFESDDGEVVTIDENANVVRIMTMHKSKGLEFPVCILANLHKRRNNKDEQEEVIYHSCYGLAMNYVDYKRRIKCKDLRKKAIASIINKDSLSEELRIFYVAMTRAKEKLIMTAVSKELEAGEKPADSLLAPLNIRMKMNSYLDMLSAARYDDDWNGQMKMQTFTQDDLENVELTERVSKADLLLTINEQLDRQPELKNDEIEELNNRINFEYAHKNLQDMYVKTSVSELKMAAISDAMVKGSMEEIPAEFFEVHDHKNEYIPAFAREETKDHSGTAIGSSYHRVLELIEYKNITGSCDLDALMASSIDAGAISLEDYDLVNKEKIELFLASDLAKRMILAAKSDNLYKEQPFVLGINANRINPKFPSEEQMLIQGIIDVYFIENNEIVLMDYKTDRVDNGHQLIDRYATQLDFYEEALSRITGLKVKEKLIYSFALGKTIKC